MICLAPRAREKIVRPRRLADVVGRPLSSTVRRHARPSHNFGDLGTVRRILVRERRPRHPQRRSEIFVEIACIYLVPKEPCAYPILAPRVGGRGGRIRVPVGRLACRLTIAGGVRDA